MICILVWIYIYSLHYDKGINFYNVLLDNKINDTKYLYVKFPSSYISHGKSVIELYIQFKNLKYCKAAKTMFRACN